MSAGAQTELFAQEQTRAPESVRCSSCRCEMCCPENPAPTYTEAFRHECEVRYLAAMPSNEHRREYLEGHKGVLERRGAAAHYRLRASTWALMQRAGAEA